MGLLAPGRNEKVGCATWMIGGIILIIAGIGAMIAGVFDALF
jgi:hypothetical protein